MFIHRHSLLDMLPLSTTVLLFIFICLLDTLQEVYFKNKIDLILKGLNKSSKKIRILRAHIAFVIVGCE